MEVPMSNVSRFFPKETKSNGVAGGYVYPNLTSLNGPVGNLTDDDISTTDDGYNEDWFEIELGSGFVGLKWYAETGAEWRLEDSGGNTIYSASEAEAADGWNSISFEPRNYLLVHAGSYSRLYWGEVLVDVPLTASHVHEM